MQLPIYHAWAFAVTCERARGLSSWNQCPSAYHILDCCRVCPPPLPQGITICYVESVTDISLNWEDVWFTRSGNTLPIVDEAEQVYGYLRKSTQPID